MPRRSVHFDTVATRSHGRKKTQCLENRLLEGLSYVRFGETVRRATFVLLSLLFPAFPLAPFFQWTPKKLQPSAVVVVIAMSLRSRWVSVALSGANRPAQGRSQRPVASGDLTSQPRPPAGYHRTPEVASTRRSGIALFASADIASNVCHCHHVAASEWTERPRSRKGGGKSGDSASVASARSTRRILPTSTSHRRRGLARLRHSHPSPNACGCAKLPNNSERSDARPPSPTVMDARFEKGQQIMSGKSLNLLLLPLFDDFSGVPATARSASIGRGGPAGYDLSGRSIDNRVLLSEQLKTDQRQQERGRQPSDPGSNSSRPRGETRAFPVETVEEDAIAPGPTFDNSTASVVTAVIGRTAFLPCVVRNLGDRTVSWIRRADLSVLSVGRDRYIQDRRFQVMASSGGSPISSWALQLAYPNPGDSGVYECQLGSVPKISRHVTLRVIARTARIWGGPQLYVNSGSGVNLTCQLTGVTESPRPQASDGGPSQHQSMYAASWPGEAVAQDGDQDLESYSNPAGSANGATTQDLATAIRTDTASHVFWYHNGEVVNYEHMKKKAGSSRDERSGGLAGTPETIMMMSVLRIRYARASDSGNYSCAPSDALPAHITLHVLHGEHPPAAMQDPQPSAASPSPVIMSSLGAPSLRWRWRQILVRPESLALLVLYATLALTGR
ncbi:kin of IRRE protein 1-like [Tropilaelaps mercedesae]|uniref:Kin of IRRE protein 1-like n=1 Tax=Tropilaelaps mercedesae TaxID=418985 RepID=A0A1V9XJZ4_9ACAR|nr:kin of IRRE protein 1-like [Tropilaelaps mercedesae]